MDDRQFDRLAQRLASGLDRRTLTAALGAALAGAGLAAAEGVADAKGKGKHRRHRDHGDGGNHVDGGSGGQGVAPAKKKKCKNGTTKCGKKCRDLSADPANCGACGHACGSGQGCSSGSCATGCGAPNTLCGQSCVNTQTDESHCGGCGHACGGDETCCNGSCLNTQTDGANCGGCGHACGSGESCQSGQCQTASCGAGEFLCGGSCVPSVGDNPCCTQADCGGPSGSYYYNYITCDTTIHQCRCINEGADSKATWGICHRTADGRGLCGECCLGSPGAQGSQNCPGEWGCNGLDYCSCPADSTWCDLNGAKACYRTALNADRSWDPTHCPQSGSGTTTCYDCTEGGTKPNMFCCSYGCWDLSGYGPGTGGISANGSCGGCTKACPGDRMCCNDGPGTAPTCKLPRAGVCPPAGMDS